MFNDNLKLFRKERGFSQEQLSVRLNVVRQTISKWEKGLSVPDAEMLVKISEVLNVSVSDLLGKNIVLEQKSNELATIAMELQKLNELLLVQQSERKKLKRKIIVAIEVILFVLLFIMIYGHWNEMFYQLGQNVYNWIR